MVSELKASLFLGDLPYFCTEMDIFDLLQPFGNVYWIRIHRVDKKSPPEYAFASMPLPHAAHAIKQLQGQQFKGRRIFINWVGGTSFHRHISSLSVFFRFESVLPSQGASQKILRVNEEFIRSYFESIAVVSDVNIKESKIFKNVTLHKSPVK